MKLELGSWDAKGRGDYDFFGKEVEQVVYFQMLC